LGSALLVERLPPEPQLEAKSIITETNATAKVDRVRRKKHSPNGKRQSARFARLPVRFCAVGSDVTVLMVAKEDWGVLFCRAMLDGKSEQLAYWPG
jgi:hypothetical protein